MDQGECEEACSRLHRRADSSSRAAHGSCRGHYQRRAGHRAGQVCRNERRGNSYRGDTGGLGLNRCGSTEVNERSSVSESVLAASSSRWRRIKLAIERTFAMIKPDAVSRGQQGEILARIHKAGFTIVAIKSMRLTKEEAGGFYAVHRERPFFAELTDFMSSGKIFAMVLEAESGIAKWRDTMGATDPKKAAPGTIRHDLGTSIGTNCTHGSDAPETAAFEIGYFFPGVELI